MSKKNVDLRSTKCGANLSAIAGLSRAAITSVFCNTARRAGITPTRMNLIAALVALEFLMSLLAAGTKLRLSLNAAPVLTQVGVAQ